MLLCDISACFVYFFCQFCIVWTKIYVCMFTVDWITWWCVFYAGSKTSLFICFFFIWLGVWSLSGHHSGQVKCSCMWKLHNHTINSCCVLAEACEDTCTVNIGSSCTAPALHYRRSEPLSFPSANPDPSLMSHLQDLGIGYHLSCRQSHQADRHKRRLISFVCGWAILKLCCVGHPRGANLANLVPWYLSAFASLTMWPSHLHLPHITLRCCPICSVPLTESHWFWIMV